MGMNRLREEKMQLGLAEILKEKML